MHRTTRLFLLAAALAWPASPLAAAECPAALAEATRLILVTAAAPNGPKASLETFERATAAERFRRRGTATPAVVGRNGVGWGWGFRDQAAPGDAIKVEGDGRTPAGLFKLGRPFGFEASPLPGYLRLEPARTWCVDEPRSEHYNRIVAKSAVPPGTSGEDMRSFPIYRHGLVVDYPSNSVAKAGSCIFVHLWRSAAQGTAGCVAADERTVTELQSWAARGDTWIAIHGPAAAAGVRRCIGIE